MGLEKLVRLPQPSFEKGDKNPLSVLNRKILGVLPIEAVNFNYAPFSQRFSHWPDILKRHAEEADEFMRPAHQLMQRNLYFHPEGPRLRAGGYRLYIDSWLRDSMIGTLFLEGVPRFELALLSQFEDERTHGQIPTTKLLGGNRIWTFDDESTMLALLWRTKIAKQGAHLTTSERTMWNNRWNWIKRHADDILGASVSPGGTESSWFDTYRFPWGTIITYNQGIYAATALAAEKLGFEKNPRVAEKAKECYQRLTHPSGRFQLSRSIPHKDTSSLMGEFLSLYIFNESLLPDETVLATVNSLSSTDYGYKVVTRGDDSYLDPSEFNVPYKGGEYQNGDDWPMFSAIARAVGERHGLPHSQAWWILLFEGLNKTKHAESINSKGKENHLWNTACYAAAKMVLADWELKAQANFSTPHKSRVLYSGTY